MKICKVCNSEFTKYQCHVCKKRTDANWRSLNKERCLAVNALYKKENAEKVKEANTLWNLNNKEAKATSSRNYKARKKNASGTLTRSLKEKLMTLQNGRCVCCKVRLTSKNTHMDHVVPLKTGGSNTDDNIQLLCQPCNNSKGAKDPIDFMQSRGFLL